MIRKDEARRDGHRGRASNVFRQIDASEIVPVPHVVHRLARRLGVSVELATAIAGLAGLGPMEARQ